MKKILVAGIGNIFFGDDGWGVEVARALATVDLPAGVRVVDFGIRGLDLTYALLDGYDAAVLVDVVRRGGTPGTLYLLEPDANDAEAPETHDVHPARALAMARAMRETGEVAATMRLVGCEPATIDAAMGLSPTLAAAVGPGAALVAAVVRELAGQGEAPHA